MALTEYHHAALIGLFYRVLKDRWGEAGVECFQRAIKRYAEQRGRRMALRAKAHGFDLDFFAYFSHGEWAPTQPPKLVGKSYANGNDWVILNPECPWFFTFQKMELLDCAKAYCTLIDTHLLKGFNPELKLEVTSFLHSSEHCSFQWKNADLTVEDWRQIAEIKKRYAGENVQSFDYHTGHVWKTFEEEIREVGGDENLLILKQVEKAFEASFGRKAMKQVLASKTMDFSRLPRDERPLKCYEIVNCPMNGTDPRTAKCQVYQEQVGCWEYDWGTLYRDMPGGEEKEKWRFLMAEHCPNCPAYQKHEKAMKQRLKELKPMEEGTNEE